MSKKLKILMIDQRFNSANVDNEGDCVSHHHKNKSRTFKKNDQIERSSHVKRSRFILKLLFDFDYLSESQLNGLKKYKYSAVDTSPLSNYVMHPLWNSLVKFIPMWVSPNLMTFAGFCHLVLGYIILSFHDFQLNLPNKPDSFSKYVWLLMFFLQLISYTLDGMDGKQARRTKTSSALGELFDHGLDSWACGFFPLPFFSVVSTSPPFGLNIIDFHFFLWLINLSFFLSHWEKYNTGTLYLPWFYDLSMVLLAICYWLVFLLSPGIFQFTFPFIGLTFAKAVYLTIAVSVIFLSFPVSAYNILKSFQHGSQMWSNKREVFKPWISMLVLFALSTYWTLNSYNGVPQAYPRLVFLVTSTAFSSLVCRLIVAEMSATQCKMLNLTLVPYVMVVFASTSVNLREVTEIRILKTYATYLVLAHIHYGICTARQIARHLGINVFYMK